jgi:hypothetical protein
VTGCRVGKEENKESVSVHMRILGIRGKGIMRRIERITGNISECTECFKYRD